MTEPKAFASLSSTLLARKGHAKPAMRPQGFSGFGMGTAMPSHDDLGWNDMGQEAYHQPQHSADIVPIVPELVATPMAEPEAPAPVRQQAEIARELAPPPVMAPQIPAEARKPRAAAGSKGKAAFTLRLDPDRHLKLRLACAVHHRSAQAIVAHALDLFLETQPEVAALAAASAKSKS
jgi:plasmid stability protein